MSAQVIGTSVVIAFASSVMMCHSGMKCPWIDIGAELLDRASEGLSLIESLSSWANLDYIRNVLVYIQMMPLYYHESWQGDDLECCAAVALGHVNELVQQAPTELPRPTMAALKSLQRHMQDVVLLACARFMDQTTILEKHRIQAELQDRLDMAFQTTVSDDLQLWQRLGNSKYQLFNQGMTRRGRRRGRGRCKLKTMGDEASAEAVARDPLVISWVAPCDLAADAPTVP